MEPIETSGGSHLNQVAKQSDRAHARLASILQRRGIEGIDENSKEGLYIKKKVDEYAKMASESLPDEYKKKLIQSLVETEILKNSSYSTLIAIKVSNKDTPEARAKRQTYQLVYQAYSKYTALIDSLMKSLTGGADAGRSDNPDSYEDRIARMKKGKE